MTEIQKRAVKILLQHAWNNGFGNKMPLTELSEKVGVTPDSLYDTGTMSGELWDHGDEWGDGLIEVSEREQGIWIGINFEMKGLAEAWSQ